MSDDLEPLAPDEALDMWIDRLEATRADATLESYRYRMESFVQWCEDEGIDNLNDLTSRDIFRFDSSRRSKGLSVATLNTQLGTLKLFIRFCARLDAVPNELPAKVEVPSVELADRVNDELLSAERAETIRAELHRYKRASRRQAMFELLWHTGCRLGGLRALDLDDCFFEQDDLERLRHQDDIDHEALENVDPPFVYFRHREGTPLKNKQAGERPVALSQEVADCVQEYIDVNRVERDDENDRRPLFATEKGDRGRVSKASIRREIYILTQPCRFGSCPHDRNPETCEALKHGFESRCPSSRSPHPIRTGAVTHMRDEGWPPEVVAERVNATPEVIREHYDHPDPIRRMQSRRDFLAEDPE
ncbi:tyrosine-type recombinase/integrase [Natronobacterium gregoryi]|uniref:Integrase n=2 Tax=Natronobacterium gregoryi TaxID=44930 RepID=L0AC10_NATGS|nr:tyrosine-type recombinase/integrase [Natronobacterium gregoryi]AFZ71438.1 site-specific recombinase XerD [Natronobacterium gregoryi SP2]ELY66740.1 integrase [Natronobacterium gregoryi SP2]PLK19968.1 integrase [Natronobacterium gregoryi SP2]SFJ35869.1 Site-specific recombinase XerD [Natronobacterium gregoryi]